jgi:signal transduction histidine kinase
LQYEIQKSSHKVIFESDTPIVFQTAPGSIGQIFTNLIMNSIKHGFKGALEKEIHIDCQVQEDKVIIHYRDNGKGIAPEIKEKIFDPFFTTDKQDGTGLGLHVLYNLITHKLGGSISLEPSDEGVYFRVELEKR